MTNLITQNYKIRIFNNMNGKIALHFYKLMKYVWGEELYTIKRNRN